MHRRYLWHLSPELMKAIRFVEPAWLGGTDTTAVTILRAVLDLHGHLQWERLDPYLERAKREGLALYFNLMFTLLV